MKTYLKTCFALLLFGMLFCTGVRAQDSLISLDADNLTLEEAIGEIEKQSEYSFLYSKSLVDMTQRVTLKVTDQPLRTVLDRLFSGTRISWTARDRQIILSRRTDEPQPSSEVPVEKNVITGKVLDGSGEPVIGAGIIIEGTMTGTTTDLNGAFNLEVEAGSVLTVTSLGYETTKVAVTAGRSSYTITLQESSEMLDDVVIVGYGVQKKASITGAITNVSGDELKVNATVNTSSALAGTIAGINSRMSDGRPGATTKISIRGMGSPLYIIDGVQQTEAQFNNIDANDIESISILKDASAAIYGLRAANGVVVVKTKSGRLNTRHTVNVKTLYGWQEFFRFPQPASAASYVRTKYQSDVIKMADNPSYTPTYSKEEYLKWQAGTERGYEGFDWLDYATNPGPQSYFGANISGGSDKVSYYVSLSNTNQDYAIRDFGGFNRTNIQVNVNANITKRFSVGAQVSGRLQTTKAPGLGGGDEVGWMLFGSYRNLPTVRPFVNDNPMYPAKTAPSYIWTNFAVTTMSKNGEDVRKERVAQINLNAEYKFTDWLSLRLIGGYSFLHSSRTKQVKTFDLYDYDESTGEYYVIDGERNPELYKSSGINEDYSGQFTLDFHKQFGQHNVALTVGGEASHHISPSIDFTARPQTDMSSQVNTSILESLNDYLDSPQARAGFIGRFTYDYGGRYLLELMGRYDGSWKFPPSKRWGFFPSVSAGWRMTEEPWWDVNLKRWVSNLKFKASYGAMGDESTAGYSAFDYLEGYTYNSGGAVLDGQWVIGSQYRGLPVTDLSWQTVTMFNVGIEYGFFDNRLTGEINYFSRTLDGIPASPGITLPNEVGFTLPNENMASQKIRGFDGSMKWSDRIRDFSYSVEGNFTFSRKYEWDREPWVLSNSWQEYRSYYSKRYANQWWGYECIGQFQSWEEIASYPVDIDGFGNTTMRPGDLILKDQNGDGVINDMDSRPLGYRQDDVPYMSFNFNIALAWKGFDLSLLFTGASMASFYMDYELKNPLHDGGNSPAFMLDDAWHLADIDDPDSEYVPGKYPMVIDGNGSHSNYQKVNNFWLRNVTYVKLRNLEFGYSLPKRILNKAHIENIRVFTSMQNLFSIDNLGEVDIDPEIATSSGQQYPTTRVISFGLNLTF